LQAFAVRYGKDVHELGLQGQRLHDADGPDGLGGRRCHGSFPDALYSAISLIRAVSRLTTKKKTGNATATMQPKVQFIQNITPTIAMSVKTLVRKAGAKRRLLRAFGPRHKSRGDEVACPVPSVKRNGQICEVRKSFPRMSARMREAATPIATVLRYSKVAASPVITIMLTAKMATWALCT